MPPVDENSGAEAPASESADTSTDFDAGFDQPAVDDLMGDLAQDAGGGAEGEPAGDPGEGQQQQAEGLGQQPPGLEEQQAQEAQQQQAREQQAQQDASLLLNSAAPLDQLLGALMQNEGALVQAVAQQQFQLSEADKEALETDAVAAMPMLGAKVYVKSLQAATSLVRNMVPQMLNAELNKHQALMSVEQAFFQTYPQLDRWQHGQDIVAVGQALKAQNPQMPPQELLGRIASAVMGMHGIQPTAPRPRGNGQRPFTPAASGPPMGQVDLAKESPFAGLGLEYDE